jgi:hypothetical protein
MNFSQNELILAALQHPELPNTLVTLAQQSEQQLPVQNPGPVSTSAPAFPAASDPELHCADLQVQQSSQPVAPPAALQQQQSLQHLLASLAPPPANAFPVQMPVWSTGEAGQTADHALLEVCTCH